MATQELAYVPTFTLTSLQEERMQRRYRARQMRQDGMTLQAIADDLGVSVSTIRKDLQRVTPAQEWLEERERLKREILQERLQARLQDRERLKQERREARQQCQQERREMRERLRQERIEERERLKQECERRRQELRQRREQERQQRVLEMFHAGHSHHEIATALGVGRARVWSDLQHLGLTQQRTEVRQRQERQQQAWQLRQQGMTIEAIAAALGVHTTTIWQDLQRFEPTQRSPEERQRWRQDLRRRRQLVPALRQEGKTIEEIAAETGTTYWAVKRDVRSLGITRTPAENVELRKARIEERRQQAWQLRQEGKTLREIAILLDTNYWNIKSDLQRILPPLPKQRSA